MSSDRWQSTQLSPAVAFLLHSEHFDPTSIRGTGRAGRILKGDVLKAMKEGTIKKATGKPASAAASSSSSAAASAPAGLTSIRRTREHVDLPLTQIRKVIASRLSSSKQSIPHAYASITMNMGAILALRAAWKAEGRESIPSVNDLIIRASALALRQVPAVNTVYDARAGTFSVSPTVDISVAVATETGLITPIVKRADTKRLETISNEVRELAGRAKMNKLKPDEFQGGSFTSVRNASERAEAHAFGCAWLLIAALSVLLLSVSVSPISVCLVSITSVRLSILLKYVSWLLVGVYNESMRLRWQK